MCRKHIRQIEENLKSGKCVCYRDYVSQYLFGAEFLGNKMNNFQLVLIWRDDDTKSLFSFKVPNFCGSKQSMMHDLYFTADVFKFHFGKPNQPNEANFFSNLFEPFHTVYMVGDHGVLSKQGLWHESMLQTKYDKTIYALSLFSHHAPNRADGAGQAKRLALMAAKAKLPLKILLWHLQTATLRTQLASVSLKLIGHPISFLLV